MPLKEQESAEFDGGPQCRLKYCVLLPDRLEVWVTLPQPTQPPILCTGDARGDNQRSWPDKSNRMRQRYFALLGPLLWRIGFGLLLLAPIVNNSDSVSCHDSSSDFCMTRHAWPAGQANAASSRSPADGCTAAALSEMAHSQSMARAARSHTAGVDLMETD